MGTRRGSGSCGLATRPALRLNWWPCGLCCGKCCPRYGLGRSELPPVRKGEQAIAAYVGKYLEGGLVLRKHSWKGCRRVEFDRRAKHDWIACSRVFAWHSTGAIAWRKRVGEVAAALGVEELAGIKRKLGPKWAYRLRKTITSASEEDWQLVLHGLGPERALSTTITRPDPFCSAQAKSAPLPAFQLTGKLRSYTAFSTTHAPFSFFK